ncbi:MAG: type II secretion system protein [Gemmatimonadaceae bacterium]
MRKRSRRGFTLPEVLVTVTIIAVLAAVVVPAVVQNVKKGDNPSFLSDVSAYKTAMTAFAADNRAYPKSLTQLYTLGTGTPQYYDATNLVSARWKGPYLTPATKITATNDTLARTAGYNLLIRLNSLADTTNEFYVQIDSIDGVAPASATIWHLDSLVDNGDPTTGMIRFKGTAPAYYRLFLIPKS